MLARRRTEQCLNTDSEFHIEDHCVVLGNVIKRCLSLGQLEKGAKALNELRRYIGAEQAKVYETLYPYMPIGNSLSKEMAARRLQALVNVADQKQPIVA